MITGWMIPPGTNSPQAEVSIQCNKQVDSYFSGYNTSATLIVQRLEKQII